MAATEPPDKQERGRPRKRRYFRRRRRKGNQDAALAAEQRADDDDAQPARRTRPKSQNRRRSENRRRSSRRRSSAARSQANQVQHAEEESQPQGEVYIYTHVVRPTYREGLGGEFQADHSLNLSGATASAPVGMDYLLESIERQLDEWFNPSPDATDGGEGQEEEPGYAQEMTDENSANDNGSTGG
jgi:hypothetical protein